MGHIKGVIIVNFALDVVLCAVSCVLNIVLFSQKHETPVVGKIGLLFATLCFAAFTYFALWLSLLLSQIFLEISRVWQACPNE